MNGAVYSMTGFATATAMLGTGQSITIDIRSVNSRFLDLSFRLPDNYRHLEVKLREQLIAKVKRGKCEVRFSVQHHSTSSSTGLISAERIQSLLAQQTNIHAYAPHAAPLSVADIITLATNQNKGETEVVPETEILTLFGDVLQHFIEARALEGHKLTLAMQAQTQAIRSLRDDAMPLIPLLIEQQRQRFLQKFNDAVHDSGGKISASSAEERALSEATAFAIRVDVTEEIDRLASHLTEIDNILSANSRQEVGKRLEFLIQELHREANTLGSKSATLQTTKIAVDMKVLIEQLREQVQNIE